MMHDNRTTTRPLAAMLLLLILTLAAVQAAAEDPAQRNELGVQLARQGKIDDALRQFTFILSRDPENPAALNNAANIYAMKDRHDRARKYYEQALAGDPEDGGINLNLALVLHELGEAETSSQQVELGLLKIGDIGEAYYMLGLNSGSQRTGGRASEGSALSEGEIEHLLAAAMANVQAVADTTAGDTPEVEVAGQNVDTFISSTRAGTDDGDSRRLYWKLIREGE